ncbi:MAG: hypothetical protein PHH00_01825 [Candidatus Nanoarchaeia archaeon]|nr:hypothetical protein [Candidatus Nanoarchaeia archaeon]
MTDAVYPNRELILSEDDSVERPLKESFLEQVHEGNNVALTLQLSPILKRNKLPDGSEVVTTARPRRLADVGGRVHGISPDYVQILTKYKKVREVPYQSYGRRDIGLRLVRIPLDRIKDYQIIR